MQRRVPGASLILQLDEPSLPSVLAGRVPTESGFSTLRAVEGSAARDALARTMALEGRLSEAETEARAIIRLRDTSVGVERGGMFHDLLGSILDKRGRFREAETEYRHQIEAAIRPFRDILLGMFFISVGMLLDWFSRKHVDAFADSIIAELLQRFPQSGADLSSEKSVEKAMKWAWIVNEKRYGSTPRKA